MMFFVKILGPLAVALLGLGPAHARDADCAAALGAAPRIADYPVRVDSGPIFRQCEGTCRYEAALGHIQNRTGVAFSSDYLAIKRMMKTTIYAIEGMENGHVDRLNQKELYIDTLECRWDGQGFWDTLWRIRHEQGLMPARAFAYTPEFTADMHAWAERLGVSHPAGPLTVLQLLDVRNGLVLQNMKDQLETGDRPKLGRAARAETEALFARALAGVHPAYDAETLTDHVLAERELIKVGPAFAWRHSTTADAEATLTSELDAGRNVVMHAFWRKEFYDRATATYRFAGDVAAEHAHLMSHQKDFDGHAVVVDGYARDAEGRLEWLLLKDSQGPEHGERGFVHMRIEYFRSHLISINAIGAPRAITE